MGVIIGGKDVVCPGLYRWMSPTSYKSDPEPKFKSRPRRHRLRHIVIHETAGPSKDGCIRTLTRKGFGVHIIIDRGGEVSCHGDLLRDRMIHANQLNNTSIGIEIVNPYAPSLARGLRESDKPLAISPQWWTWVPKADREKPRYLTPTEVQMDSLKILVPWLCRVLDIPYEFPTWYLGPQQRKIKNWRLGAKPDAGIVAHRDFGKHADGRYPLEGLILEKMFS